MKITWNEDTIRWYKNANAFTSFHKNVANAISKIEGGETLCDLGCGLGLIDLELAAGVKKIDCFDISRPALDSLNDDILSMGIQNIETHLQDCETLSGKWDIALMCYFGTNEYDRYAKLCKRLIAVVGRPSGDELFPTKYRKNKSNTIEHTLAYLDAKQIEYRLTEMTFEFGQPLVSLDDAKKFVISHAPEATDAEIEAFFSSRLTKIDDKKYRYYIKRMKPIGIFELKGEG